MTQEDKHLKNLIDRLMGDFLNRVGKETDAANLLLKGHLLVENLLTEILAAYDVGKNVRRLSFHEKIKLLGETKCSSDTEVLIKGVIPVLRSINELRNNLAHEFNFVVTMDDVNKIGIHFGSTFILKKYETNHADVHANLLFCLDLLTYDLGLLLYTRITELKKTGSPIHRISFIPQQISAAETR